MGAKQSRCRSGTVSTQVADSNGQHVARAISKGRVYVVISYPREMMEIEPGSVQFDSEHFRELLAALQEGLPDLEITLDAGPHNRFCQHANFFNSTDKNKFVYKYRVLVEVFYTGWTGVDKELVKRTTTAVLDPNGMCHFDVRTEMGRYHTTPHLETLLRI